MSKIFKISDRLDTYLNSWLYYNFSHEKTEKSFSLLIDKCSEDPKFKSFLTTLLNIFPQTDDYFDYRWILSSKLLQFDKLADDFSIKIALSDFNNLNTEFSQMIKPLLDQPNVPEPMFHPVCFNLLFFRDSNPGLFYTLLPKFQSILKKIGFSTIYKAIGPEALSFIIEPDYEFFKKLEVDPKVIVLFFKYPISYKNSKFSKFLHAKFNLKTPQCKFVDVLMVNQTHFLCFLDKQFPNFLNSNNITQIPPDLAMANDVIPYLITKNYQTIFSNPEKFKPLLQLSWKPSLAAQVLERIINDFDLMSMISFLTSNELTVDDLLTHSITFHCQFSLGTPQLLEYATKEYFLISDSDRQADFDVIRGYTIMRAFLSSFRNPSKQTKQMIQNIKNHLTLMMPKNRHNLCIDLFSLIFIKQNDKFVCHPIVASKLIKMITEFESNNPYFSGAKSIFANKKPKKTGTNNLSVYLQRDTKEIYNLILNHKWEAAEEKTLYLPYYRKFYNKAHCAYILMHKQQMPSNLEKEIEVSTLDIACSELKKEMIKEVIEKNPSSEYSTILGPRMKMDSSSEAVISIQGNQQWEAATKSAVEIDQSPLEQIGRATFISNHLKNITISKGFLKFISDTVLYYESASLYEGDGTLESIFTFDMRKALSGPFNIGNERKSEQLANIFNVDLFSFVIKNLAWFKITENFINKYSSKYPLETTTLSISESLYKLVLSNEKTSQNLKNYVQRLIPPTTPEKGKNNPRLLTLLKNNNMENVDDIIYKVDHKLLYSKIMSEFDHTSFSDSIMYALNICDYVAPDSDIEELEKIRLYYKINKLTNFNLEDKESSEVVIDIYKNESFELALKYIKICVPSDLRGPPICSLFQQCIDNEDQMLTIIRDFKERFDLISSRFFHVEGVVKLLVKECPKSKINLVKGLSLLPETITLDSNIFDLSTVIESFSRHPECIFMLNQESVTLFNDNDFLQLLDLLLNDNSPVYNKAFSFLLPFFKNKDDLQEWWMIKICKLISEVKVDSVEKELEYIIQFHKRIDPFLQTFKGRSDTMQWIKCANVFVQFQPFCKFNIKYDMNEYQNDKYKFALLCMSIDKMEIANSLNIDISEIFIEQIKIMMILGATKQIQTVFKNKPNLKFDDFDQNHKKKKNNFIYYDNNYKPFQVLTRQPIFDINRVKELSKTLPVPKSANLEPLFVFQQIKITASISASRSLDQQQFMTNNNKERDPFYDFMIKNAVTKPNSLSFLVTYKDYEAAFNYLDTKTGEERNDLFLYKFFVPAICNNTINSFEKYILKEKGEEYSKFIWTNTLQFFERRQCRHVMYNINKKLGNWEAAADDCFRLFDEETSVFHQIELLGHAIYCLTEALNIENIESKEQLEEKKTKTMFQLKLCQFFNDKGMPNKKEYNLMRGESAALALGAVFLINGETQLLNELSDLVPIDPKSVSIKASDTLLEMPIEQIMNCLSMMRTNSPNIVENVQVALLRKLQAKGNRKLILNLIINGWKNPLTQLRMMIEYDYITEAMILAVREKIAEMIPSIGKRASELGINDIVNQCYKILYPIQSDDQQLNEKKEDENQNE